MRKEKTMPDIAILAARPDLRQKLGEFMRGLDEHFQRHPNAGHRSSDPLLIRSARDAVDDWRDLSDQERALFTLDQIPS